MSVPEIVVRNAQRKIRVSTTELQRFAERALRLCLVQPSPAVSELSQLGEVSVVLVSDRRIAALHEKFMNIAGPTDVITFQHGEIFISTETAQRQAEHFRTSADDELRLYVVHGLLHLHEFDDTSAVARKEMHAVQRRIYAAARVE